jgi:hypothetical protein
VGDGLGVGGDAVMQLAGEVDMLGPETRQDLFDESQAFVRGSMLDQDLVDGVQSELKIPARAGLREIPLAGPGG